MVAVALKTPFGAQFSLVNEKLIRVLLRTMTGVMIRIRWKPLSNYFLLFTFKFQSNFV